MGAEPGGGRCGQLTGGSIRRRGVLAAAAAAAVVACAASMTGTGFAPAVAGVRAAAPGPHWGRAEEVPGTAALNVGGDAQVSSMSCWRVGDCAAGGFYTDSSKRQQAFVVSESNAVWGTAAEVPGTAVLNAGGGAEVLSLSCAPGGGCAAGGYYTDSAGNQQAFVVSHGDGGWGDAQELPGTAKLNAGGSARVISLSCPSTGNCGAAGGSFVETEANGRWGTAHHFAAVSSQAGTISSVSCPSAGNCTVAGLAPLVGLGYSVCCSAFALNQRNGLWRSLYGLTGEGPQVFVELSCSSAGNCGIAGAFDEVVNDEVLGRFAFQAAERNRRWGLANVPASVPAVSLEAGPSQASSVSCPSATACTAGGYYTDAARNTQAWIDAPY